MRLFVINPASISLDYAPGTFGDIPRNFFRAPFGRRLDLSLAKLTRFRGERASNSVWTSSIRPASGCTGSTSRRLSCEQVLLTDREWAAFRRIATCSIPGHPAGRARFVLVTARIDGWIVLTAGLAKVCITPPLGVPLAGFAARHGNATGVHDDLYVRACVIGDDGGALAFVTVDLLALDARFVCDVRRTVHRVPVSLRRAC